jgi:hypothetical protein
MEEKPILYNQLEKLCEIAIENNFREAVIFISNVLMDYDLFYEGEKVIKSEDLKILVDIMKEVYADQISSPGWKGANW